VVWAVVLLVVLTWSQCFVAAGLSAADAATDPGGWTVYHGDRAGSGVAQSVSSVDTGTRAWTSPPLDGQLYGEPLVDGGRVYVATENDTVYALSSSTGAVVWSNHLASPVPASSLPCGDIEPTVGITGTPVVDEARGELFVVADELKQGAPAHVLVGLSTVTGSTELTQPVDPPGAAPAALLQRTGLTLASGQVVFGFGGNYGDCSTYRGWVVGVPEAGGTPVDFGVDTGAGQSQGAIWMGGAAPAVDGAGNLWVGVGNGSVTSVSRPYDHSDSVLELTPALRLVQYFAPTSWATDNARDRDLSMAPVLLPDGQVVIAGKAGIAYLLDGAHLGGIGGQRASLGSACPDDVDGGGAAVGTVVYLPCLSGIVAVRVGSSPPTLDLDWSSGSGGGPPIVAAGLVWTIGQDGTLSGLDPTTGSVRQQASVGAPANHFPTPGVGDGLLLAPSADRVVAFSASPAPASTSPSPTPSAPGHRPVPGSASGLPAGAVVGIVIGGVVVIGGVAWWVRRRKKPAP
jgi:PQQ-like domain